VKLSQVLLVKKNYKLSLKLRKFGKILVIYLTLEAILTIKRCQTLKRLPTYLSK